MNKTDNKTKFNQLKNNTLQLLKELTEMIESTEPKSASNKDVGLMYMVEQELYSIIERLE